MTRGFPPFSTYFLCVSSMSGRPPMPEPTTMANRSRLSSVTGVPASSIAKCAAPIP